MGTRPMAPTGLRPPVPVTAPQPDGTMVSNQQKSRAPVLEDSFMSQHDSGDQNSANSMPQDVTASEKKVSSSVFLVQMYGHFISFGFCFEFLTF